MTMIPSDRLARLGAILLTLAHDDDAPPHVVAHVAAQVARVLDDAGVLDVVEVCPNCLAGLDEAGTCACGAAPATEEA